MSRDSTSGRAASARFIEAAWDTPLDIDAELATIPEYAQVRGTMIAPVQAMLKKRGWKKASSRERYLPFTLYPLREHAALLVEYCHCVFPQKPLRQALRKVGRAAPQAFGVSTLGRVTLGSAEGVQDIVSAFAKAYELSLDPGRAVVTEVRSRRMVVSLEDVYYFLDSHHVGSFEGILKQAGLSGSVLIARRGVASADLLLQW